MDNLIRFIGENPLLQNAIEIAKRVGPYITSVLICGETGVGKTLLAEIIHSISPQKNGNFVEIDASVPSDIFFVDANFGHNRGAYTGAYSNTTGNFERANNGTLFIDNINFLSIASQISLLKVLESGKFKKVGSSREVNTDFRLICAANQNLEQLVQDGKFREDLLYRINVVQIDLPPLRSRRDDIPLLVDHFINMFCKKHHFRGKKLSQSALAVLQSFSWPGNIRELENVCEHLVVMSKGDVITPGDLSKHISDGKSQRTILDDHTIGQIEDLISSGVTLPDIEREAVKIAWEESEGNKSKAAGIVGIPRETLRRRLRKHGIIS